ncbi:hypothetical protein [Ferriphaselus sp. R-1]|uniref:hypothetical protein n=1 Tax=Ferriphaselus sp. R-1 TaxID=1485544 RepID=UPI001F238915|nr:hypothetical protein [Ferriphaselus sp. R-1]
MQIQQHSQMQEALTGADKSAIPHPNLIGGGNVELALHEIGSRRCGMVVLHDDSEAPFASCLKASLPPKPGYPMLAADNALHVECTPSLHGTIGFSTGTMHFFDLLQ